MDKFNTAFITTKNWKKRLLGIANTIKIECVVKIKGKKIE